MCCPPNEHLSIVQPCISQHGCLRAPQAPKAPPLQRLDLASRHLANLYVRNLGALANDQLRALFQARRPPGAPSRLRVGLVPNHQLRALFQARAARPPGAACRAGVRVGPSLVCSWAQRAQPASTVPLVGASQPRPPGSMPGEWPGDRAAPAASLRCLVAHAAGVQTPSGAGGLRVQDFGPVETASVLKTAEGVSRGVGFVQFYRPEDAARARTAMNNKQARAFRLLPV